MLVAITNDLYAESSKFVPIDKISVSIEYGNIMPKCSTCSLFYWIPSKKKKRFIVGY